MKKVISIVGPTGSGKTAISIELAKHLKTEIINCDSVQMVRGLDIGSAKITEEEKQGIKHHLIDHVDVLSQYTIYDFQQDARGKIDELATPILVGGSGLYLKSVLYDYTLHDEKKVEDELEMLPLDELIQKLKSLDPLLTIDFSNKRRVIRAIRQAISGHKRSEQTEKDTPKYDNFIIYLDVDRHILKKRLETRLDHMVLNGMIEEARLFYNRGLDLNIIGYRELNRYFRGEYSLEKAKEAIISVSMKFAKKQKTFFKNQMTIHTYDALDINTIEHIIGDVDRFLEES